MQGTVVPAFAVYSGSPGLFVEDVPECTENLMVEYTKSYYEHFKPKTST